MSGAYHLSFIRFLSRSRLPVSRGELLGLPRTSAGRHLGEFSNPNYPLFAHRLSPGWLFGWKVDTSDHQWNSFRSHLPMLLGLLGLYMLSSTLFNRFYRPSSQSSTTSLPPKAIFILSFALPLLFLLHGSSLPKILGILTLNFWVSRLARWGGKWTKAAPVVGWTVNLAILFSNELCEGYRWGTISSGLAWLDDEAYRGILPRWHINWNITMLRLISFNLDYYWACTSAPPPLPAPASVSPKTPTHPPTSTTASTERALTTTSHPLTSYSFPLYLAYTLYPPLYLAGPIITYNSFVSQLLSPLHTRPPPPPTSTAGRLSPSPRASLQPAPEEVRRKLLVSYAIRFLACLLTMEVVLHSMYVVAIKDESRRGAWEGASPMEVSMVGFWNLIVVWLKLLIPWRFFRLWALLDGIDPPENMVRCMANNYSTLGFWRSWHRSYNLWVVRYIYIPLGGTSHAWLATLIVFTFVALWHDLSLKLLTWGWVISLFVLPEMIAKKVVPWEKYGHHSFYRHLAALGGVVNILMMLTANLIGFAIGTEGTRYMWRSMVGSWEGIRFMVVASACLFVAVQVMFEYREEERRRGISRRC
ncbi:MBOAT, membrane-bound O-acyltransferase family-domain-containing protein [Leucosporidium creatinivorum]|uniref:MBOAT, membrane-bound O-acyltransferase family-domain-containing protein n=1 Tax=Leucosporidium creatinivorum TaxID=106004 RepID=A0A1Y2F131_9BASI|nr:MBOAT, membrane-bound O-acyltransferase family-domain-containing protein [Leucosporidium creatinivorum]